MLGFFSIIIIIYSLLLVPCGELEEDSRLTIFESMHVGKEHWYRYDTLKLDTNVMILTNLSCQPHQYPAYVHSKLCYLQNYI